MKARLYDSGKKYEGYVDRLTLYFPYPKWLQKKDGVRGCYLGCSVASDGGMIRCTWNCNENSIVNSPSLFLGKKLDIDSMPEPFRKIVRKMEQIFNDALKFNDEAHWKAWEAA